MDWQTLSLQTFELGESPFWHPDEQTLYWVDIPARAICRANVYMGTVETWPMPLEPGCIAPARAGGVNRGYVIALRDGIYRATEWRGELRQIARATHDTATTRFNDGKADPAGRFWAGTIYEPSDANKAQLFSLDCRPSAGNKALESALELKADNAIIANGLAWSPDAKTVYWADTHHHIIRAWDWNAETNAMSNMRVFAHWPAKPEGWAFGMPGYGGRPDGAAVDVDGNYWVAMFEGARIMKLSPAGSVLAEIALPAQCPTMPCLGGEDGRTLYVTTARHNRSAAELAAYPESGGVFFARVERPGLPVNFFED